MAQTSLYRYCRPADGILDSKGPLSRAIAPSVLAEVNREAQSNDYIMLARAAPLEHARSFGWQS
ncbi:MAG: hypothetical protein MJE68_22420 [Proteobacteria bacterium]|nr:hypothetical protein [Pseudomonadota bacterium]